MKKRSNVRKLISWNNTKVVNLWLENDAEYTPTLPLNPMMLFRKKNEKKFNLLDSFVSVSISSILILVLIACCISKLKLTCIVFLKVHRFIRQYYFDSLITLIRSQIFHQTTHYQAGKYNLLFGGPLCQIRLCQVESEKSG